MQRGVVLAGVGAALLLADVILPRHGWGVPIALAGLLAAALHLDAVRRHRPARALPWLLRGCGLLLPALGVALQSAMGRPALFLPAVSHGLIVAGMVCSSAAFALFIRARTRALDRYHLLDLAVFAVAALTSFKLLVLDPLMDAHPPVGMSVGLSASYLLILIVNIVLVVRFVALPGDRVPATWFLLASTFVSLAGSVVVNATAEADGSGASVNLSLMVSCLVAVLGAQHVSMARLTEPVQGDSPGFGPLRVAGLGLALFLVPATSVIVHERTGSLDTWSVLVPMAVVTTLVLVRLRLVFVREEAARDAVAASEERFVALIQGITDVIAVTDRSGAIGYVTNSAARALGQAADDLIGRQLADLVHDDDADLVRSTFVDLPGSGRSASLTVRIPVGDVERVFELEATDRTANVRLQGIIVVLHDVTHRHHLEDELRHQALHDVLTGLPNRALFTQRVADALAGDSRVSVLFVDLDDFKDVNDGLGHHAGDALLTAVAGRLRHAVRDVDTVARLGGDEFAILVVDPDDPLAPQRVAARALAELETPFDIAGQRLTVGASIGLAGGRDLSVEDILRHADIAMYRAKAAGKGTLALFEPEMQEVATERISLHADLAQAVAGGQLRLLFQPIVDLESGRTCGGEALVRWQHPSLGLLAPDRFIGLAEDTGLIVPVGSWVLHEACTHAAAWPDDVTVAVNLSARQLEHEGFLADVEHALLVSGLPAERLVLEVTETAIARDRTVMVARLERLRSLGIRIAMDDFGTGYSSLSSLIELPVDILKIDRSFITGMLERPEPAALVQAVLAMGHALELDVVAEGVEDASQAVALRAQGCHHGQGFLFSHPVPERVFRAQLDVPEGQPAA